MTRRCGMVHGCLAAAMSATVPVAALELVLPVDCEPGRSCFVQQYMDHDPGPGARDYACGTATYDGHDGTDFRLATTADVEQGTAVVAAADGIVRARRDGMPDQLIKSAAARQAIQDRECGNGVVIDHGDGWQTQYCHLRRGSVIVGEGEPLTAGQKIGEIGYSGAAAFPHVHVTVRRNGEPIDPFLGPAGEPQACGADAQPLWTAPADAALDYRPGELLDIGFAEGPVALDGLEAGTVQGAVPDQRSPAIVAWGWAIKLQRGDEIVVVLEGPDGELARNGVRLDADKAQYMLFAGTRRPAAGWLPGRYTAVFTVSRAGEPVISARRPLTVEAR